MAHLLFDGCDAVDLAREFGTPLYVLSEDRIRVRIRELRETFLDRWPGTSAAYASKALQTLDLCRIVASEDLDLDVVSGGELYAALKAGFPPGRIHFHGNSKTPDEIRMALDGGVGRMIVDNRTELDLLDREARARGIRVPILFRVTPGVDSHTHQYMSTGSLDSKFGIPLDPAVRDEYVEAALRMEGIELRGFHFHVGSQIFSNESHRKALRIVADLAAEVRDRYGFETRELILGGGFAARYTAQDEPEPLAYYTDALMTDLRDLCAGSGLPMPRVGIEPGRWIVAEAGITLYTVGSVKEIPGVRTYVGVDGGMPDNIRPALYGAEYEATVADRHDEPRTRTVTVAGKCCESGDILIRNVALQDPRPGDVLAVFTTGAYTHSMASNYNRLPRPAMVLVRDGKARLSVRRETYEDLVARELLS
ncbi:MAG TPA: diaminopimelate decarboxylase [Spirochaetia bacterium]|nr:diaminopimelate decarboxylase [Spirochaetales bacterium]HRY80049.1 diaminopimelate decarboxylase [Spirochaetia bacterium]